MFCCAARSPPDDCEQHNANKQHHVAPVALITADPLAKRAAAVNGMDEVIDADIDGVLQFSAAGGLLLRDPAEDFLILLDHAAKVRRLRFGLES